MKKENNFLDAFLREKGLTLLFLLVTFILLFEFILEYYNLLIVNPVLSKIKSFWLNDILFFLLLIFTAVSTVYLIKKNKRISNLFFTIILLLYITFSYCRFSSELYIFQKFDTVPSLFYADFLFLFFGSVFIIKGNNWLTKHKPPEYGNIPFIVDNPIEFEENNGYSRKVFAEKIAEKIKSKIENDNFGALAIGINGTWGSGKTSFLKNIDGHINNINRIKIHFNPWRSSSPEKITEDFFELFIAEIKEFDPNLSNELLEYAKSLTKIKENFLTKSVESFTGFLFEGKNKNKLYDSINDSIKKIKKQIIIFIDDLDRLDKKELIEVLRIIRNTANFKNVVYVVSYDKEYVLTAIKSFNEYNYRFFLEKIFQFEFFLPMYDDGVLRSELKKLLSNNLKTQLEDWKEEKLNLEIERVVNSDYYSGRNFTNEIVRTFRDVHRFVNSFVFEIDTIKEEVFFYDFYLLQLLKLKYSKIYTALIDYRHLFFIIDRNTQIYKLRKESDGLDDNFLSVIALFEKDITNKNASSSKNNNDITNLERYLEINNSFYGDNGYDKNLIIDMIDTLLTLKKHRNEADFWTYNKKSKTKNEDQNLYNSFAYPYNFHKYFAFKLYEGDISSKEFEQVRREDFSKYKDQVFNWIEEGKSSILVDRLEKIEEFSTTREFENHILILLEIGRNELQRNGANSFFMDYTLILKNLKYPKITNTAAPYEYTDDYKDFLLKTFKNAVDPTVYESNLIKKIITEKIDLGLSFDILSEINFNYFKEYCIKHNRVTDEFRQLHTNAIKATGNSANIEIQPEAQILFKKYFLKNITGCQLSGFIKHAKPESDYFNIDFGWVKTFFDDPVYDNLEKYLDTALNLKEESNCYNEFMEFFNKFKNNSHENVEFSFELIKPNLWSSGTKSNPVTQ